MCLCSGSSRLRTQRRLRSVRTTRLIFTRATLLARLRTTRASLRARGRLRCSATRRRTSAPRPPCRGKATRGARWRSRTPFLAFRRCATASRSRRMSGISSRRRRPSWRSLRRRRCGRSSSTLKSRTCCSGAATTASSRSGTHAKGQQPPTPSRPSSAHIAIRSTTASGCSPSPAPSA
eukprot:Amastigsp_a174608_104.p3 type:complete len:178 gc:universal Amastigsp_a174608_104:384-917(+)